MMLDHIEQTAGTLLLMSFQDKMLQALILTTPGISIGVHNSYAGALRQYSAELPQYSVRLTYRPCAIAAALVPAHKPIAIY